MLFAWLADMFFSSASSSSEPSEMPRNISSMLAHFDRFVTAQFITGTPFTGMRGLGMPYVRGLSLVPFPAASIIAFMKSPADALKAFYLGRVKNLLCFYDYLVSHGRKIIVCQKS